jgi:hypothetical protein
MKHWSFYDSESGLFTGNQLASTIDDSHLLNTPLGCGAIEGDYDRFTKKVDIKTGEVVDHVPDQPSEHHEWDDLTRRWKLSAAVQAKQQDRAQALATISQLEAQCIRPMREHVLGIPGALDRLASLETAIASERAKL